MKSDAEKRLAEIEHVFNYNTLFVPMSDLVERLEKDEYNTDRLVAEFQKILGAGFDVSSTGTEGHFEVSVSGKKYQFVVTTSRGRFPKNGKSYHALYSQISLLA